MGAERVLVIGTDTLARIIDWEDRNTAILFGDGSGAVVLEAVDGGGQLLGWDLDADGSAERFLYAEVGDYIKMDGKEVFRRAVRIMVDSAQKSMAHAGVTDRRHRPDRAAPGEHADHRRRLRPPRHRHGPGRRSCSTAPATRRRPRSRSPSSTPSTTAACTRATSCCSSASAPA